jgi:hypothetical protein
MGGVADGMESFLTTSLDQHVDDETRALPPTATDRALPPTPAESPQFPGKLDFGAATRIFRRSPGRCIPQCRFEILVHRHWSAPSASVGQSRALQHSQPGRTGFAAAPDSC